MHGRRNSKPGANAMRREVKAEGGRAALCTEACMIHPETDQPVANVASLYDEGDIINHRHMTDNVHRWGALAGVELCHAGGLSNGLSTRYVSPAAHQFATPWIPQAYTYEAEESDFLRIIRMYAEAARRAIDAGFDILYVHGTHGARPAQMLSPFHNRRRERWGGLFEPGSVLGGGFGSRPLRRGRPLRCRQPVLDRPAVGSKVPAERTRSGRHH